MIEKVVNRLEFLTDLIPSKLTAMGEPGFSYKSSATQWSKKEIIGHLIDSATNNHHRFVRAQFEETPEMAYDQDKWCEMAFHQQIEGLQIISFWPIYNKQLVEIIKRITIEKLSRQVKVGSQIPTLEFLIVDYIAHLEHHLRQVVEY